MKDATKALLALKKAAPPKILQVLLDAKTPFETRQQILRQLLFDDEEQSQALVKQLLEAAAAEKSEDLHAAKIQELAQLIQQMMEGPLRAATFVRLIHSDGFGLRAEVLLPDGTPAFTSVPDEKKADSMRCGDPVWLEAQGKALLYHHPAGSELGDEAQLERLLADGTVEVQVGEMGRFVYLVAAELQDQLDSGAAGPGSTLVVCPRRRLAFRALPVEEGVGHLRFASKDGVPDVIVERDIGAPPAYIDEFTRHLERELDHPHVSRRYGLRRSRFRLLTGVPGTGKTFSIQGFWRCMYEAMSERSGIPVEDLPQRVMQLKMSEVLSKWVGSSDRNIARFFDEVDELAAERLVTADGREIEMPTLITIEEAEGFGRERGEDSIHDRIQTTLLQNLDPSRPLFRDRLVFVISTTNTPQLVDPAFVRRVGGAIENFGRMDRVSFRAVVEKQISGRPFHLAGAPSEDQARARAVDDLTGWFFDSNSAQPGVVELTFAGQTTGNVKHHRDFLTAALVDRAVQEACAEACDAEWLGAQDPGLSTARLIAAMDRQVLQIVEQLTPQTCDRYLTLPDGVRVTTVRRLEQPAALPFELECAS